LLTGGGFDARTGRGTALYVHRCAAHHPTACGLLPHLLRRLSFRLRL